MPLGLQASHSPNLLAVEQPNVDASMAEAVAASAYGLDVRATLMAGERDRNFLLRSTDGARRVLKFYNVAEDDAGRDLQRSALVHLERHCRLPVPRLVQTRDGEPEFVAAVDGVAFRGVLITFIDGVPLGQATMSPNLRVRIGRACAELDRALETLEHPAARRDLLWDVMQIDALLPVVDRVEDPARRRWIREFVESFAADVRPSLMRCRAQTIHNDISTHNLFVASGVPAAVSGIIDFGDMVHAPLINEIGIAASYVAGPADDLFAVIGDLVSGYEAVTRLSEAEIAHLYDVVVARVAARVLIYAWRSSLFPGNREYILRNSASALALLDAMTLRSRAEGRSRVVENWRSARSAQGSR